MKNTLDTHQTSIFSQSSFDIDSDLEHDWLKREIVVDVPPETGVLMVSLELTGDGSAWINDSYLRAAADSLRSGPISLAFPIIYLTRPGDPLMSDITKVVISTMERVVDPNQMPAEPLKTKW